MLTPRGIAFLVGAAFLYALGLLTGYDQFLVLAGGAVAAVAAGSLWVVRRHRLEVERMLLRDRVTRGSTAPDGSSPAVAELAVHNPGRLPSPALVAVEAVGDAPVAVAVPRLAGGGRAVLRYSLPTDRRGVFDVGPVEVTRADPLGLWRTVQRAAGVDRLWVHPVTHVLDQLPTGRSPSLEGDAGSHAVEGGITFHALREYVPGDDLRLVHWRSYARTGDLMVRENVDTGVPHTTVLADTACLPEGDVFESAMEVAASVAATAARSGRPARLVTSCGRVAGSGSGGAQGGPSAILDTLAALEPAPDAPRQRNLATLAPGRGNDVLVAVTAAAGAEGLAALVPVARRFRHTVLVLVGPDTGTQAMPSGLASRVVRATTGDDFARRWNAGATR